MHDSPESTSREPAFRFARASRARNAPLLIGATFLLGGCASMPLAHEPWVYAISRHVYTSDAFSSGEVCCAVIQDANSQSAVVAMLCVVALPFALDTVLLPITIPHDVWMTK